MVQDANYKIPKTHTTTTSNNGEMVILSKSGTIKNIRAYGLNDGKQILTTLTCPTCKEEKKELHWEACKEMICFECKDLQDFNNKFAGKYWLDYHPEDDRTPCWLEVNNPTRFLWRVRDNWIPCVLTVDVDMGDGPEEVPWYWGEQLKFSSPRAAEEFIRKNLQV